MFTGIIKDVGTLLEVKTEGANKHFTLTAALANGLSIDQSVAHDGVCLTVVALAADRYTVIAIDETLQKTNLGHWEVGRKINLELALQLGTRLDGHFVQGHVDTTGMCEAISTEEGSHVIRFSFPEQFAALLIEKGSICINGVSLTCFNVQENRFEVAIIPYTFEHTNFQYLKVNDRVNLEFDILGKYFLRQAQLGTASVGHTQQKTGHQNQQNN